MTVAFYAALHCIDARLADDGSHPQNHGDRVDYARLAGLTATDPWLAFEILKDLSEQGRYNMREFEFDYVERAVLGHYLLRTERLL